MKQRIYLTNIHTNKRYPNCVYAEIRAVNEKELIVSATLGYCAQWIHASQENKSHILCDESGKEL